MKPQCSTNMNGLPPCKEGFHEDKNTKGEKCCYKNTKKYLSNLSHNVPDTTPAPKTPKPPPSPPKAAPKTPKPSPSPPKAAPKTPKPASSPKKKSDSKRTSPQSTAERKKTVGVCSTNMNGLPPCKEGFHEEKNTKDEKCCYKNTKKYLSNLSQNKQKSCTTNTNGNPPCKEGFHENLNDNGETCCYKNTKKYIQSKDSGSPSPVIEPNKSPVISTSESSNDSASPSPVIEVSTTKSQASSSRSTTASSTDSWTHWKYASPGDQNDINATDSGLGRPVRKVSPARSKASSSKDSASPSPDIEVEVELEISPATSKASSLKDSVSPNSDIEVEVELEMSPAASKASSLKDSVSPSPDIEVEVELEMSPATSEASSSSSESASSLKDSVSPSPGIEVELEMSPATSKASSSSSESASSLKDSASPSSDIEVELEDLLDKKSETSYKQVTFDNEMDKFMFFKNKIERYEKTTDIDEKNNIHKELDLYKKQNKKTRLLHQEYFDTFNDTTYKQKNEFVFTQNQKFLQKFLSFDAGNRGILLFHGVGVGKTCASIKISENFTPYFDKSVLIICPSSLEKNYRKELFDIDKIDRNSRTYSGCHGQIYLDNIEEWYKLSRVELKKRVNKLIDTNYSFYGFIKLVNDFDKMRENSIKKYGKKDSKSLYDFYLQIKELYSNRVIIIDEVHNLRVTGNDLDITTKRLPKILETILTYGNNIRLVLLSATPMFDKASELELLMKLLHINDKHYKNENGVIEFKEGELTQTSKDSLREFATNYVSFVKGYDQEYFPYQYYYENSDTFVQPKYDMLEATTKIKVMEPTETKFDVSVMNGYQLDTYREATQSKVDMQVMIQISNISYPSSVDDINYKKSNLGFLQVFKRTSETSNKLKVEYIDNTNRILEYDKIGNYSSKMKRILEHVEKCQGSMIIYSKYLWSGVIPMCIALEEMGFDKHDNANLLSKRGKKKNKSNYIVLSGTEMLTSKNSDELSIFNSAENANGDLIKIAIINDVATEGVSFQNVREIHILEPWYNMNRNKQIIGRGVRYLSHHTLPPEKRNVRVHSHMNMIKDDDVETIDYRRYRISVEKDSEIAQVETVLKKNAIDCILNKDLNSVREMKGQMIDSNGDVLKNENVSSNHVCDSSSVETRSVNRNTNMLLIEIIQICNSIKEWIGRNSEYAFTLKKIQKDIDHILLKDSLNYMVENNIKIKTLHSTGTLIKLDQLYIYQQEELTDQRMTIQDRMQAKTNYIEKYKLVPATNTETSKEILLQMLEDQFADLKKEVELRYNQVDEDIVVDMVIDSLPKDKFDLLMLNIKYVIDTSPKIYNSLVRGNYLLVEKGVYYHVYDDRFYTLENSVVSINDREKHTKQLVSRFNNDLFKCRGFIKLDKTRHSLSLSIKHMNNLHSKGSYCIATASFTVKVMNDYINDLKSFEKVVHNRKLMLCTLYEYVLRVKDLLMRPVEYELKKKN